MKRGQLSLSKDMAHLIMLIINSVVTVMFPEPKDHRVHYQVEMVKSLQKHPLEDPYNFLIRVRHAVAVLMPIGGLDEIVTLLENLAKVLFLAGLSNTELSYLNENLLSNEPLDLDIMAQALAEQSRIKRESSEPQTRLVKDAILFFNLYFTTGTVIEPEMTGT